MYCSLCGKELVNGENVCRGCGAVYQTPQLQENSLMKEVQPIYETQEVYQVQSAYTINSCVGQLQQPQKKSKAWLVILISVLAIILLTTVIAIIVVVNSDDFKRGSVEGTIDLLIESLEQHDLDKYMDLHSMETKNNKANYLQRLFDRARDLFECKLSALEFDSVNLKYEITDIEEITDKHVMVSIEVVAVISGEIKKWNNIELKKFGDKWYIVY